MRVDKELCFRCAACSGVCPRGSIMVTEFDVYVSEICDDCGICEQMCPVKAIIVEK